MIDFDLLTWLVCESHSIEKTVVIYPGRFHPFHKGHGSVYKGLVAKYPKADVYVATSAKVEPPKSPFTFDQKKVMMKAAGIPEQRIVEVRNPYMAVEIMANYDLSKTAVIFAVSKKDMLSDPRFSFKPKKDGSASFFQPLRSIEEVEPSNRHGYIDTVDTLMFTVLGNKITSASQIRELYHSSAVAGRKQIIVDLYGSFNPLIFKIFESTIGV